MENNADLKTKKSGRPKSANLSRFLLPIDKNQTISGNTWYNTVRDAVVSGRTTTKYQKVDCQIVHEVLIEAAQRNLKNIENKIIYSENEEPVASVERPIYDGDSVILEAYTKALGKKQKGLNKKNRIAREQAKKNGRLHFSALLENGESRSVPVDPEKNLAPLTPDETQTALSHLINSAKASKKQADIISISSDLPDCEGESGWVEHKPFAQAAATKILIQEQKIEDKISSPTWRTVYAENGVPVVHDGKKVIFYSSSKANAEFWGSIIDSGEYPHYLTRPDDYENEYQQLVKLTNEISEEVASLSDAKRDEFERKKLKDSRLKSLPLNLAFVTKFACESRHHSENTDATAAEQEKIMKYLGNIPIPNFKNIEEMGVWVENSLVRPLFLITPAVLRSRLKESQMRNRFRALSSIFQACEKAFPYKYLFRIYDAASGHKTLSEAIDEACVTVGDDLGFSENDFSFRAIHKSVIYQFAHELAKTSLGTANYFLLGISTGLRPSELVRLTNARNLATPDNSKTSDRDEYSTYFYDSALNNLKFNPGVGNNEKDFKLVTKIAKAAGKKGTKTDPSTVTNPLAPFVAKLILTSNNNLIPLHKIDDFLLSTTSPNSLRKIPDFAAIVFRSFRVTASTHLVYCESDRDPRSAPSSVELAAERLGHKGIETLKRHYVRNKPPGAKQPSTYFGIHYPEDRISFFRPVNEDPNQEFQAELLNGQTPWDAWLTKLWVELNTGVHQPGMPNETETYLLPKPAVHIQKLLDFTKKSYKSYIEDDVQFAEHSFSPIVDLANKFATTLTDIVSLARKSSAAIETSALSLSLNCDTILSSGKNLKVNYSDQALDELLANLTKLKTSIQPILEEAANEANEVRGKFRLKTTEPLQIKDGIDEDQIREIAENRAGQMKTESEEIRSSIDTQIKDAFSRAAVTSTKAKDHIGKLEDNLYLTEEEKKKKRKNT